MDAEVPTVPYLSAETAPERMADAKVSPARQVNPYVPTGQLLATEAPTGATSDCWLLKRPRSLSAL